MGLGGWIQGRRDALKQSLIQRAVDKTIASIDSWGIKKWPVGWIRVRRAGVGWKTILGGLLFYSDDIMNFADQWAPGIVSALGMDDHQAQAVVKGIGGILFLIGAADKYLKFTRPLERRAAGRVVETDSGGAVAVAPQSQVPLVPVVETALLLTTEERVVFDSAFATAVRGGATLEGARAAAEAVVSKVRTTREAEANAGRPGA